MTLRAAFSTGYVSVILELGGLGLSVIGATVS
jgi:hypothetical protein